METAVWRATIRFMAGGRGARSGCGSGKGTVVVLVSDEELMAPIRGLLDELDAKHGEVPPSVRAGIGRDARRVFNRREEP